MFNKIGGYLFNDTIYLKTMEVMSISTRMWTIKRKASHWHNDFVVDHWNYYLKANSSSLGMIPIHLLVPKIFCLQFLTLSRIWARKKEARSLVEALIWILVQPTIISPSWTLKSIVIYPLEKPELPPDPEYQPWVFPFIFSFLCKYLSNMECWEYSGVQANLTHSLFHHTYSMVEKQTWNKYSHHTHTHTHTHTC